VCRTADKQTDRRWRRRAKHSAITRKNDDDDEYSRIRKKKPAASGVLAKRRGRKNPRTAVRLLPHKSKPVEKNYFSRISSKSVKIELKSPHLGNFGEKFEFSASIISPLSEFASVKICNFLPCDSVIS